MCDREETQQGRSPQEVQQEAAELSAAQIANGGQRDAFAALGHTVLFTASIAFIGDIRPAVEVQGLWLLMISWTSSVIGLFALTLSFQIAHSEADKRRQAIHDVLVDDRGLVTNMCNGIALWTFPLSMLLTVVFAAVNIGSVT